MMAAKKEKLKDEEKIKVAQGINKGQEKIEFKEARKENHERREKGTGKNK